MIMELKRGTNVGRRGARDALGMEEKQEGEKIATRGCVGGGQRKHKQRKLFIG